MFLFANIGIKFDTLKFIKINFVRPMRFINFVYKLSHNYKLVINRMNF